MNVNPINSHLHSHSLNVREKCVPANQSESSFSINGKILGKVFKISLSLVEIPSYTIVVR